MSSADWEPRLNENRLGFLQWAIVAVFFGLLSGFWQLQVLRPDYYSRLAEQNYLKNLPITAPRGRILDRDGQILVDNYPSFSIIGQWDYRKELNEHLPALARGLGIDVQALKARVKTAESRSPYAPIVLRENATRQDIAFVESHRREFPELDLISVPRRLYFPDGFGAHLFGYVGEIAEQDLGGGKLPSSTKSCLRPDRIFVSPWTRTFRPLPNFLFRMRREPWSPWIRARAKFWLW
jgi:penicillin-binding protein 2